MKRLFAIGSLILLLYHTMGPMLGFWAEEWREDQQLSQRLTVYHSTDDLTEFEFPVPLHQYGQNVDETVSGEFEYQGRYYNMVRQELRNDTLHLYCYEDVDELARHAGLRDFIQKTVGGDARNHSQKGIYLKFWQNDYAPARRSAFAVCVRRLPFPAPTLSSFFNTRSASFLPGSAAQIPRLKGKIPGNVLQPYIHSGRFLVT